MDNAEVEVYFSTHLNNGVHIKDKMLTPTSQSLFFEIESVNTVSVRYPKRCSVTLVFSICTMHCTIGLSVLSYTTFILMFCPNSEVMFPHNNASAVCCLEPHTIMPKTRRVN